MLNMGVVVGGINGNSKLVSESGLYALVLKSRKPEAQTSASGSPRWSSQPPPRTAPLVDIFLLERCLHDSLGKLSTAAFRVSG